MDMPRLATPASDSADDHDGYPYPHAQVMYSRPTIYLRPSLPQYGKEYTDRYIRDANIIDVTNMGVVVEDDDALLTFYPWSSVEKITEGDGLVSASHTR